MPSGSGRSTGSGTTMTDDNRGTMRAIGIDIGGTSVKAGRISGGVTERFEERPSPARAAPDVMITLLADLASGLRAGEKLPIGVGCAGLVDHARGRVRTSPNLPGWTNEVPLADRLEEVLGSRPLVLNDANAFVLAESRLGAAEGARTVVGLTMGTGVGGGLVLDGRIWTGCNGAAGEIGHMPLVVDGPLCACGARGCLEALIGTRAILDRYQAMTGSGASELSPRDIAERAERGDAGAILTWRETGRFLGLALVGLTHLLDPELFIIGGGISRAADLILPAAREALRDGVMLPPALVPPVVPARLGPDAGWIGAALAAFDAGAMI